MVMLLLLCVLVSWCGVAAAARTVFSEGVIPIKLEDGQPTAIVFPEEISTVTTVMPERRLTISKDYVYLGLIAVDPTIPPNRLIVVGISGRVYLARVEVVAPGKRGDDLVYVTHKAPPQAEILTPVSVLRTLRSPKGAGPSQPLTLPLPTPDDPRISLVQPQQYTLGPYQALVLTIVNTQATPLHLDERVGLALPEQAATVRLHDWVWPPNRRLSGVAVEQPLLLPHGSTTLYAIFQER